MILKKLAELLMHIVKEASSVQYILCRLADVRKSITSMFEKLQKRVWREDGDLVQDSILAYSEMPGVPKQKYKNEQHKKAMTAPIIKQEVEVDLDLEKRAREAGL
jgi:hypothetical protein